MDEKELQEAIERYGEEIFVKMYSAVDRMVSDYNMDDKERNLRNSGFATAYAIVLRKIGHEVDLRIYNAGGYDLTDQIIVDGKTYDFFHT